MTFVLYGQHVNDLNIKRCYILCVYVCMHLHLHLQSGVVVYSIVVSIKKVTFKDCVV